MRKHLNTLKIGFIILILLTLSLSFTPSVSAADKFFTYSSVLEVSYEDAAVNDAVFQPDGPPVSIPLKIRHKVEVPEEFISSFYLRLLFLQTFIVTSAQIKMEIVNAPDWAAISLSNANPYVDIATEFEETTTSLVIAAHKDAPAEGFTLRIKAEVDPLLNNHVPANEAELNIYFFTSPIIGVGIDIKNPVQEVSPGNFTKTEIELSNHGNIETTVTISQITSLQEWETYIIPNSVILPMPGMGENETIYFLVKPPDEFEGIQIIELKFSADSHLIPGDSEKVESSVFIYFYN